MNIRLIVAFLLGICALVIGAIAGGIVGILAVVMGVGAATLEAESDLLIEQKKSV